MVSKKFGNSRAGGLNPAADKCLFSVKVLSQSCILCKQKNVLNQWFLCKELIRCTQGYLINQALAWVDAHTFRARMP